MAGKPWHGRKRAMTPAQRQRRYRAKLKREGGNSEDGKRYWLTPPDLYAALDREFNFDFDPCPHPKPSDFDGLECDWGKSNFVNPPFSTPTAWARKAIAEHRKGKTSVLVYPMDGWLLALLEAGAEVRNLGRVCWRAVEDGSAGRGLSRPVAAFVFGTERGG